MAHEQYVPELTRIHSDYGPVSQVTTETERARRSHDSFNALREQAFALLQ